MKFTDYQKQAAQTAIYPGRGTAIGLSYVTLGLVGESGEIAEKVKKIIRDNKGFVTVEHKEQLIKELGDVLWYISALCGELNCSIEDVAQWNLEKLQSRKDRGVLGGSGDDR